MSDRIYRLGVISDTHGRLPAEALEMFEGVDGIIHAGDVVGGDILIELEALAPVHAVRGNMDAMPEARNLPAERRLETPIGRIAVVHGHLAEAPTTDLKRMKEHFDDFAPGIVVFGHSHVPTLEEIDGVSMFNPGSAGQPRFGRAASVGFISGSPGERPRLEHRTLAAR